MKHARLIKRGAASLIVVSVGFVWATNQTVLSTSRGRIYTELDRIPAMPVGLVLGTSPRVAGHPNSFFEERMNAAAELYRAGKVQKLLVSGDNGTREYDEPRAMQQALMKRGVPKEALVPDYAGFRTLDSIVRAKKIFEVGECTIVTDDFHLPRALYIAREEELDAIGYQSATLPYDVSPWTHIREIGARTLVWLDLHVFNRQPRYLGPREPVFGVQANGSNNPLNLVRRQSPVFEKVGAYPSGETTVP